MWIYEVNVRVEADLAKAYAEWLVPHARAVQQAAGFLHFSVLRDEMESGTFSVRYSAKSREVIEHYISELAPGFRAEGEKRFGGRFQATRQIWQELACS